MAEVAFAKTFLASLEKQGPPKIQSDHVFDPKTFVPKGPYTLPRNPTPMKPPGASPSSSDAAQNDPSSAAPPDSISIVLKSARNPKVDVRLAEQGLSTSVLDLKSAVVKEIGDGVEMASVKILYKKKPCADSRTIKEVLGDDLAELKGQEVEFVVMVMGYKPNKPATAEGMEGVEQTPSAGAPVAQGSSGGEELEKDDFWHDLKGFLSQRLRDEVTAVEVFDVFQEAWRRKGGD